MYELVYSPATPEHAAVNEAVNLAHAAGGRKRWICECRLEKRRSHDQPAKCALARAACAAFRTTLSLGANSAKISCPTR